MSGRSFVVTGAGSGVGRACAHALAAAGMNVWAAVRSVEQVESLRGTPRIHPLVFDVRDAAATTAAWAGLPEDELSGVVHCAGVGISGPLEAVTAEEFDRVLHVNVLARLRIVQELLPRLRASRGRVVMIGSLNGVMASPYAGVYSASMHALEAICDSLRIELRSSGVHVALCQLPPVDTPMFDKGAAQSLEKLASLTDEQRAQYGAEYEQFVRATVAYRAHAVAMNHVTDAVLHALTARWPRRRYPIGAQGKLGVAAARLLPGGVLDRWIVRGLALGRDS